MQDLIQGFNTPLPNEVPGYQEAQLAGRLPVVPETVPTLLPGMTAAQFIHRRIVVFVIAFIVAIIVANLFKGGLGNILALLALVAGIGWFVLGLRQNQQNILAEAHAGYATSKISYTRDRRTQTVQNATFANAARLGWNFDGVWFLKSDGSVLSQPDRTRFAPGYYPSPNSVGAYELWTGEAWAGRFQTTQ